MATIRVKRGTRAQLDAAASVSGLAEGEPCLVTDERRLAVATAENEYFVTKSQFVSLVSSALHTSDLLPSGDRFVKLAADTLIQFRYNSLTASVKMYKVAGVILGAFSRRTGVLLPNSYLCDFGYMLAASRIDDTHCLVACKASGAGTKINVCVVTDDGTDTLAVGAQLAIGSASGSDMPCLLMLSATKFVVMWRDYADYYPRAAVGTISGSTVSLGAAIIMYSGVATYLAASLTPAGDALMVMSNETTVYGARSTPNTTTNTMGAASATAFGAGADSPFSRLYSDMVVVDQKTTHCIGQDLSRLTIIDQPVAHELRNTATGAAYAAQSPSRKVDLGWLLNGFRFFSVGVGHYCLAYTLTGGSTYFRHLVSTGASLAVIDEVSMPSTKIALHNIVGGDAFWDSSTDVWVPGTRDGESTNLYMHKLRFSL